MFDIKKLFFDCIKYNGMYIAVGQISTLPSLFAMQDYIENVRKNNGTPFIIYGKNKMVPQELSRISGNVLLLSKVLEISAKELKELNYKQRSDLIKNHVHRAVYGFIIVANNKTELFEKYKSLKENLISKGIVLRNIPIIDMGLLAELETNKIIDTESRDNELDTTVFVFRNIPKRVTETMIDMIKVTFTLNN